LFHSPVTGFVEEKKEKIKRKTCHCFLFEIKVAI
jgi:hypothetical protein